MVNTLDHFFLIKHQLPTVLLKSFSLLSDPKINLVILGLISLFLLIKKHFNAFNNKVLYLFMLTGFVMFVCGILKIITGRARPFLLEDGISGFFFFTTKHAYLSFPSSHSALAIAFTIAIKRWYKAPILIYLYPATIAISRILLFAHFTSDVTVGLLIGVFVEKGIYLAYNKSIKKLGDPKAP